jgi:hypothetical protein
MVVDTKDFKQPCDASPPVKHRLEQWYQPLITKEDIDLKMEQASMRKLQLVQPENRKAFMSSIKVPKPKKSLRASKENAPYVKEYIFNRVQDFALCKKVKERLGSWSRPQLT